MDRSILRDRASLLVPIVCATRTLSTSGVVAQETATPLEEITMTGSRIVRDGCQTVAKRVEQSDGPQ